MAKVEDLYVGCPVQLYLDDRGNITKEVTTRIVDAFIESIPHKNNFFKYLLGIGWYTIPNGVNNVIPNGIAHFPFIYSRYVDPESIVEKLISSPNIKCECCNKIAPHITPRSSNDYICDMCRAIYELNVEKIK